MCRREPLPVVSIRRADRCLAEVRSICVRGSRYLLFQSAVRIAVSLKQVGDLPRRQCGVQVSIRRADRCLAEVGSLQREEDKRKVSIRRADRCLAEGPTGVSREAPLWRFNPPCGSLSR